MFKYARITLALGILIASLPAFAKPVNAAKPRQLLIGLELYTVRDDCAKDFPGVLKAVAKMGYSGIEFAGYFGHSAEELRKWLDEDHLACYGSHIALTDLLGDNFDKTVAFNKVLGNHLLVIPWLPDERRNTKAAVLETAKLFGEIAKKLQANGMSLAYHDHAHDFDMVEGERFWDLFFDSAPKQVAVQFDIGNALEAGVQAAPLLRKYPGRVISVHLKDFSKTNAKALLGEGDENWNEVIPLIKAKNGPRWLIVEQETYPVPPLESAEKCLHNLQDLLAKY